MLGIVFKPRDSFIPNGSYIICLASENLPVNLYPIYYYAKLLLCLFIHKSLLFIYI